MAKVPDKEMMERAMAAARAYLPADDAAKLEKLARDPAAVQNLTSGLTDRDWATVKRVLNDPKLLKRVLSSARGKEGVREILDQMN